LATFDHPELFYLETKNVGDSMNNMIGEILGASNFSIVEFTQKFEALKTFIQIFDSAC
jgi:hypothetical protein